MPRGGAEFVLDLAQDRIAIGLERIVAGQTWSMISMPGSLPCEWIPISRPPDRNALTRGVTIREALNSTLARARYGCEAITRS